MVLIPGGENARSLLKDVKSIYYEGNFFFSCPIFQGRDRILWTKGNSE